MSLLSVLVQIKRSYRSTSCRFDQLRTPLGLEARWKRVTVIHFEIEIPTPKDPNPLQRRSICHTFHLTSKDSPNPDTFTTLFPRGTLPSTDSLEASEHASDATKTQHDEIYEIHAKPFTKNANRTQLDRRLKLGRSPNSDVYDDSKINILRELTSCNYYRKRTCPALKTLHTSVLALLLPPRKFGIPTLLIHMLQYVDGGHFNSNLPPGKRRLHFKIRLHHRLHKTDPPQMLVQSTDNTAHRKLTGKLSQYNTGKTYAQDPSRRTTQEQVSPLAHPLHTQ
ncbi:hypothetical protein EDB92DRAFT_1817330 [Lactarius akahatsu]|uniref:Uncharacterized protein n=1 Tax=Lactarius akahatsu TaxID=416441 RepID=A0AAD4LGQ5_9AGAM|nr:hypothetical protein EDB92DRAFT_1817330 [Lactarius akahatsu]